MVKNLPAVQETRFRSLSWEDSLEERMATHASILAWRIPWTEEPGGLLSTEVTRVRHDWATNTSIFILSSLRFPANLCYWNFHWSHPMLSILLWVVFCCCSSNRIFLYIHLFGHKAQGKEYLDTALLFSQWYLSFLGPDFSYFLADFKCIQNFLVLANCLTTHGKTGELYLVFEQGNNLTTSLNRGEEKTRKKRNETKGQN